MSSYTEESFYGAIPLPSDYQGGMPRSPSPIPYCPGFTCCPSPSAHVLHLSDLRRRKLQWFVDNAPGPSRPFSSPHHFGGSKTLADPDTLRPRIVAYTAALFLEHLKINAGDPMAECNQLLAAGPDSELADRLFWQPGRTKANVPFPPGFWWVESVEDHIDLDALADLAESLCTVKTQAYRDCQREMVHRAQICRDVQRHTTQRDFFFTDSQREYLERIKTDALKAFELMQLAQRLLESTAGQPGSRALAASQLFFAMADMLQLHWVAGGMEALVFGRIVVDEEAGEVMGARDPQAWSVRTATNSPETAHYTPRWFLDNSGQISVCVERLFAPRFSARNKMCSGCDLCEDFTSGASDSDAMEPPVPFDSRVFDVWT